MASIDSRVPSDCEPWFTVWDEDESEPHVMPGYGRKHQLSRECWCHPHVEDKHYERAGVILHNVAQ